MNHATRFTNIFAHQITAICPHYLTSQKKHVLNYFALEVAAIIVAWRRHLREKRA